KIGAGLSDLRYGLIEFRFCGRGGSLRLLNLSFSLQIAGVCSIGGGYRRLQIASRDHGGDLAIALYEPVSHVALHPKGFGIGARSQWRLLVRLLLCVPSPPLLAHSALQPANYRPEFETSMDRVWLSLDLFSRGS